MLNTIHLFTFLMVAELGTYSAAAERLHLTQPAISQQIRLLEKQLGGVRLFRRVAQRMVLTHAGEELLPAAREIVALAERTETALLALRGQITGRVTLACPPTTGEHVLPSLLMAFQRSYPAVHLQLDVATTDQIVAAIKAERVQIGWVDEPVRQRGWECIAVAREPLVFCVPPQHPWLADPLVTVGMLREVPLILPPPGSAWRRAIDEGLRRAGLAASDLHIRLECASASAVLAAVRTGMGLGWVPLSCQPAHASIGSLTPGGLTLEQEWYIIGSKAAALGRAVHDCRAFLGSSATHSLLRMAGLNPLV